MEKKNSKNAKKADKPIYWKDDSEDGDQFYYNFDSEALLYRVLPSYVEGELVLGDVVLKREYIDSLDAKIRISFTELTHKTETPKASIAIFHGMGQSSDLFIEYAMQFVLNGYKVYTIDFRGFGWSTGVRGDNTMEEMQKDVAVALQRGDPDLPMFVYAHSMGCLIVTSFLINNHKLNISGVVLSAPLTGPPKHVHVDRARLFLLSFLGNNLPEFMANPRTNVGSVTKKAQIVRWYLTNERMVPIINSRQGASLLYSMFHFRYNAKEFKYPILVHLGGDDAVVNNEITKKFYENLGTEDKQMFEYDGAHHELQYEDCQKEMLKNTLDWLANKLNKPALVKFGALDPTKDVKFGLLKRGAPFKHYKQLAAFLVAFYYFIGYILMVTKFINKDRHEMIAFWPCSIWRKFFGKK